MGFNSQNRSLHQEERMISAFFRKKSQECLADMTKRRIFATKISCRDDNAYSLVKSSLVFVLVAGSLKREVFRLFLFFRLKLAVSTALLRSSSSLIRQRQHRRRSAADERRQSILPRQQGHCHGRWAIRGDRARRARWSWHDKVAQRRRGAPSDG